MPGIHGGPIVWVTFTDEIGAKLTCNPSQNAPNMTRMLWMFFLRLFSLQMDGFLFALCTKEFGGPLGMHAIICHPIFTKDRVSVVGMSTINVRMSLSSLN